LELFVPILMNFLVNTSSRRYI